MHNCHLLYLLFVSLQLNSGPSKEGTQIQNIIHIKLDWDISQIFLWEHYRQYCQTEYSLVRNPCPHSYAIFWFFFSLARSMVTFISNKALLSVFEFSWIDFFFSSTGSLLPWFLNSLLQIWFSDLLLLLLLAFL